MSDDIVQRIDKLILGWEREYGITNKTMVDARDTIISLTSGPGGIMEMKQTIADRETLIEELLKSSWDLSWPTMRKYETFEEYRDSVLK
jgi:hypothetical protein